MRKLFGRRSPLFARALLALALALALVLPATVSVPLAAQRPNGAGLVIRHGDGRVLVYYVEFTEPEITGLELLMRSGASLTLANFGGLGTAVCAIDGEGCPAENCFCRSYASPAFYWHYYGIEPDGSWALQQVGPSSRRVRDGDVDGWSWTSGESGLPSTSIDEIAAQYGMDRSAGAEPTTTSPSPTPLPLSSAPTLAPTPAPTPPPSPPVAQVATPLPAASPTAPVVSTPSPSPTPPATPAPTATARAAGTPTPAVARPTPDRATETPILLATPGTVAQSPRESPDLSNYVVFAAMLSALLGLAGWLPWRRRTGPPGGDGS
jgi:hypothetical protein